MQHVYLIGFVTSSGTGFSVQDAAFTLNEALLRLRIQQRKSPVLGNILLDAKNITPEPEEDFNAPAGSLASVAPGFAKA